MTLLFILLQTQFSSLPHHCKQIIIVDRTMANFQASLSTPDCALQSVISLGPPNHPSSPCRLCSEIENFWRHPRGCPVGKAQSAILRDAESYPVGFCPSCLGNIWNLTWRGTGSHMPKEETPIRSRFHPWGWHPRNRHGQYARRDEA